VRSSNLQSELLYHVKFFFAKDKYEIIAYCVIHTFDQVKFKTSALYKSYTYLLTYLQT